MNRRLSSLVFLAVVLVMFVGCRTVPLVNIQDTSINTASGKQLTLDEVGRAIISASTTSHPPWIMKIIKPGHIVGTLNTRTHMAMVDIEYTTKSYSITFKDSADLQYDAEKGTIHPSYNKWINRLSTMIQSKVSVL